MTKNAAVLFFNTLLLYSSSPLNTLEFYNNIFERVPPFTTQVHQRFVNPKPDKQSKWDIVDGQKCYERWNVEETITAEHWSNEADEEKNWTTCHDYRCAQDVAFAERFHEEKTKTRHEEGPVDEDVGQHKQT